MILKKWKFNQVIFLWLGKKMLRKQKEKRATIILQYSNYKSDPDGVILLPIKQLLTTKYIL